MSEKKRTSGLGRGLSDLLGDGVGINEDISELDRVKQHKFVNINLLSPSPYQPRHTFDEESLNNLVDSIKEKGVLQPLLVRRDPEDNSRYEIIAGERRFRASQIAGLTELPVIVKEMNNQEVLEVALIENIQRQDLNAIEEAEGYNRLIEEFNHTQEELGKIVGKSRSHVANTMRLLSLPKKIKEYVITGKLSAGHARALITAKNPEEIADKVISKGLNVRQVEKLASEEEKKKEKVSVNNEEKHDDAKALSEEIEKMIGTKVTVKFKNNGGEMLIAFDSLAILDVLLKRLTESGPLVDNRVEEVSQVEQVGNFEITTTDKDENDVLQLDDNQIEKDNFTTESIVTDVDNNVVNDEVLVDENLDANNSIGNESIVVSDESLVSNEEIKDLKEDQIITEETQPQPQPTSKEEQKGMTKEEVEKLLQASIEEAKPNFDGLDTIETDKQDFNISGKEEIVFDEDVKI